MATFVLIHGAWHGGWCYRDTAKALRAQGHTVHVPTLTGNGQRLHLAHQGITLETHVRDVLGVFEAEELDDAVLVGHSYGGMVITGVADRIPQKIRRLVYLDAFVPEHLDSLIDCIRKALPPEVADVFLNAFYGGSAQDHSMMIPALPGELFGAPPAIAEWMRRRCNAQPLATFTAPVLLSGAGASLPKTYILADGWNPSPFRHFAAKAAAAGWPCHTMSGGHGLMMELPDALAALLATAD